MSGNVRHQAEPGTIPSVGVGLNGDVGGLAGMREADLDALDADHDGAA
jgi:hypothetical protein